jgi:Cu+-exporting ATPase
MFESAALILTIVILGKYLEGKAKSTIVKMTQKMFPEDDLAKNKYVTYLEPKNRNFVI